MAKLSIAEATEADFTFTFTATTAKAMCNYCPWSFTARRSYGGMLSSSDQSLTHLVREHGAPLAENGKIPTDWNRPQRRNDV